MNYVDYSDYSVNELINYDHYCGHFEIRNEYSNKFYKMMIYITFLLNVYYKKKYSNNFYNYGLTCDDDIVECTLILHNTDRYKNIYIDHII